jgi:photosystem II cytochrome c550
MSLRWNYKTNPNVGLDSEALSLATRRNSVSSLVDYLKNPTTYDGLESIAEIHPSIKSDIYPRMRSLTDEDLTAIAGHITTKNCNRKMGWR